MRTQKTMTPAGGAIEVGGKARKLQIRDVLELYWLGEGKTIFIATIIDISQSEAPTYELRYRDASWDMVPASIIKPPQKHKVGDTVHAKWKDGRPVFHKAKVTRVHDAGRTTVKLSFEDEKDFCVVSLEDLQSNLVYHQRISVQDEDLQRTAVDDGTCSMSSELSIYA